MKGIKKIAVGCLFGFSALGFQNANAAESGAAKKISELVEQVISQEASLEDNATQLIALFKKQGTALDKVYKSYAKSEKFCMGEIVEKKVRAYVDKESISPELLDDIALLKEMVFATASDFAFEPPFDLILTWQLLFMDELPTTAAIETIKARVNGTLDPNLSWRNEIELIQDLAVMAKGNMTYYSLETLRLSLNCGGFPKSTPIRIELKKIADGQESLQSLKSTLFQMIETREQEYLRKLNRVASIESSCLPKFSRVNDLLPANFDESIALNNKTELYENPNSNPEAKKWGNRLSYNVLPTDSMKMIINDMLSEQFPKEDAFGLLVLYNLLRELDGNDGHLNVLSLSSVNCNNENQ